MKIVVAGCGRVGAYLAIKLSAKGHNVAVIDKDPTAFEHLPATFEGTTIPGALDGEILHKAGIENSDAFISVTSSDNSNIASAVAAKDTYGVPKVVARVYEPRRLEVCRQLGVPAVSIVAGVTNDVLSLILDSEPAGKKTSG